jgi:hypothetical protein
MEDSLVRRRLLVILSLVVGLGLLTACEEGDTLVFNGIDCGLERLDLIDTWQVQFSPAASTTLANCDNGLFNGDPVDVDLSTKTYAGVGVSGSVESTSFVVIGDRTDGGNDGTQGTELLASVEADSCLTLIRIWEADDNVYLQCLGTFDRGSRTISASCDSVEVVDDDGAVFIDDVCDLDSILTVGAAVF